MSTAAREARQVASPAGRTCIGTPPTPMPPFKCTGTVAASQHGLAIVSVRATFQAIDLPVFTLIAGPKMVRAGLRGKPHLVERPEAGQPHAVVLELTVHAEHELAGHADLDAKVGMTGADALDGQKRGQEVGVTGRTGRVQVDELDAGLDHLVGHEDDVVGGELDRLFLGGARLGDLAERQQLRPVGHRTVGHRVEPEVGHGAVAERGRRHELRLAHDDLLEGHDGLGRFVRIVVVVELERVGAEVLLVVLQVVDAGAEVVAAAAVEREHDLVADVDAGEAAVRAEDLGQMVELGSRESGRLATLGAGLGAGFEVGADFGRRHLEESAVAHARANPGLHASPPRTVGSERAGQRASRAWSIGLVGAAPRSCAASLLSGRPTVTLEREERPSSRELRGSQAAPQAPPAYPTAGVSAL